jgi:hypothetical protein
MDTREARDHLDMVHRILTRAENEPVCVIPGLVIAWGIAAAAIDLGQQMEFSHAGGAVAQWLPTVALVAGSLYSIFLALSIVRNRGAERVSRNEVRLGRMMGAVWFTVFVAAFAQPHVFAGWGGAAVWSMGAAVTMLIIGFSGDRRGVIGGVILLASILAANYLLPQAPGYALAAGFIFGYAIPGFSFLVQAPRGEA